MRHSVSQKDVSPRVAPKKERFYDGGASSSSSHGAMTCRTRRSLSLLASQRRSHGHLSRLAAHRRVTVVSIYDGELFSVDDTYSLERDAPGDAAEARHSLTGKGKAALDKRAEREARERAKWDAHVAQPRATPEAPAFLHEVTVDRGGGRVAEGSRRPRRPRSCTKGYARDIDRSIEASRKDSASSTYERKTEPPALLHTREEAREVEGYGVSHRRIRPPSQRRMIQYGVSQNATWWVWRHTTSRQQRVPTQSCVHRSA